jgi:L-lactate dehydrogenase (cytochrome)
MDRKEFCSHPFSGPTEKRPSLAEIQPELNPLDAAKKHKVRLRKYLSLADFEVAARKYLPHPLYAYVSGGVEDNHSREENIRAFQFHEFQPRVLKDVSGRSTATTLFGREYAAPFGIGPMGIAALIAYDGDCVMAGAAAQAGLPMVLSSASLTPMEAVAEAGRGNAWFQVYLPGDVDLIRGTAARAQKAGYETLVLTADTAARANRENNIRAGFSTPLRPSAKLAYQGLTHPRWLVGNLVRTLLRQGIPCFENTENGRGVPVISSRAARQFNRDSLNWEHVKAMRAAWRGNLVIKGVLHPGDARTAAQLGVDGIVVSNHGGRQLDGAVAPLKVLTAVAEAAGAMKVIYDGGVRRGGDVLKALALGADFVFVARPFMYAAAVGGEAGVGHCIGLLKEEVRRNMASLGVCDIDSVDASILHAGQGPAFFALS